MTSKIKLALAALALSAVTACSSDPVYVEEDYGNSVRNMIKAQTANPQAARSPAEGLPGALDGEKGEKAMEVYRDPSTAGGTSGAKAFRTP